MCRILSALCLCVASVICRAQSAKVDSLLRILPEEISDTRFDILGQLYCEISQYDLMGAKKYIDFRHRDALILKDSFKLCEDYIEYGRILRVEGKYEESEATLFKALGIAERNDYQHKKKFIYNHLGLMAGKLGAYDKALNYYFKSLELRMQEGDLNALGVSFSNIGSTYESMRDYNKAKEFYLNSYEAKIKTDKPWTLGYSVYNLSHIYYRLEKFDSVLVYANKGKIYCDSNTNCSVKDMWGVNQALGIAHLGLDDYNRAESYFQESLKIANEVKDSESKGYSLFSLAKVKFKQGMFGDAIEFLNQVNSILDSDKNVELQLDSYELLALAYESQKNDRMANIYLEKYKDLERDIFSGSLIRSIAELTSVEAEKENRETIGLQKELLQLRGKSEEQHKLITIALAIVVVLLAIVVVLTWRSVMIKRGMNKMLDQKVRSRTHELEESYRRLEKMSIEQQENINSLGRKMQSGMATLKGIAEIAKLDTEDPKALGYISKIEREAEKLHDLSAKA